MPLIRPRSRRRNAAYAVCLSERSTGTASRRRVPPVRPPRTSGRCGEHGVHAVERQHFLSHGDRARPGRVPRPALRLPPRRLASLLVVLALVTAAVACAATSRDLPPGSAGAAIH